MPIGDRFRSSSTSTDGGPHTTTLPLKSSSSVHRPLPPYLLAQELNGISATVSEVDTQASERLTDLAQSLKGEEERLRWADVDLRRAFNTEKIAFAYAVRQEGGYVPKIVDTVDKTRNVMVLLPILLTWFALFEASRQYRRFIDSNPEEIRKPFLLLWEQGFGGTSPWYSPAFSTVALMDAGIIAVIILLTFYSHGRRDQREEEIQKTANAFQTELDNVLAEATVALAPDRAGRPAMLARSVERLADRFDNASQELLNRLQSEHDRIAAISDRREKEIADFGVFASGMRAGAEESHRVLLDLRQVSQSLQQTLDDLAGEVAGSSDHQQTLNQSIMSLERLIAADVQSDTAVTRQLVEATAALADAADRSMAAADTAAQAGRVASEAVYNIAEINRSLANGQTNLDTALAEQTGANAKLADALRSGSAGVSTSSRMLSDIAVTLSQLREEFGNISQLSQEQAITLSRLISEQSTMASSLTEVARDLSAASVSTSLRQREMNDDVGALVRRLDSLTSALSQMATGSADATWFEGNVTRTDDPAETAGKRSTSLWPKRNP